MDPFLVYINSDCQKSTNLQYFNLPNQIIDLRRRDKKSLKCDRNKPLSSGFENLGPSVPRQNSFCKIVYQGSRQEVSNWRRLDKKTNDCLQNNDCICSILKSKDWINDGLVATPTYVLSKSHGQVSLVEIYFIDFSK